MSAVTEYLGKNLRQYGIMGALAVIVAIFAMMTGGKLLIPNNMASLIQQNSYVLILAIGMVMVIVAGHIDLSVGSLVAFIGGVLGWMMYHWDWPWPLAVLAALILGLICGAWQGFWVAYVRIPAFIVTLAGMLIFRGLAIVIAGVTMAPLPNGFKTISSGSIPNFLRYVNLPKGSISSLPGMGWFALFEGGYDVVTLLIGLIAIGGLIFSQLRKRASQRRHGLALEPTGALVIKLVVISLAILLLTALLSLSAGGTPIVLIIVGLLIMIYTFVLNRTVFGRHVYAIGGNLNAAILSGVNTRRVNFMLFVNMGLLSAVAAVVVTARAGAATAQVGQNYELDAIAACFIGGTAVTGGIGRISGAMVGALVMGVLNMGLSILNVDSAWQQSVKGLVLLGAVALDLLSKRRSVVS
ncbi:MAG: sugar ABC transporter permease [Bifidobacteriaceae bacterium]|jgi:putative multiple sugar transport system permease protein|nr:sugar ABC transporter permease [Bifidobacteriaceae bacterium]